MSTTQARRTRGRRFRAIVAILLAAGAILTAGGCDLRLDGAAPAAPSPGPVEQARERAVADALALVRDARAAAADADPAEAPVLAEVVAFSTAHAAQLGGPYVSGLATPSAAAVATLAPPATSVRDVVGELTTGAAAALDAAASTADGGLARLLASVGIAREQLASRLSAAAGLSAPGGSPAVGTAPAPSASPTIDPSIAPDVRALVLAHDQAGFGFEALAAAASAQERKAAAAAAAAHRSRATALATQAGIGGTPDDPRRAAYTLPASLADPSARAALAQSLETAVAAAASGAVAHAAPGARAEWIAQLRAAATAALAWGAAGVAFPGMPELASPAPA